MDIIKEFQQYPKAWEAFEKWCSDNFCSSLGNKGISKEIQATIQRYLLADMQAWLDSVGIYCDAYTNQFFDVDDIFNLDCDYYWNASTQNSNNHSVNISNPAYPTRPEALKAAVLKGCEIFQNSKTK